MTSRPTDATFAAIVSAITAIEADPHSPRTKAHLMRLTGLAHPTVHRAFRWDTEHGTPFKINERWDALRGDSATRRSPAQAAHADLNAKLKEARQEITELRGHLEAARLVAAAAWLRTQTGADPPTPIGGRRRDRS
jgi:hypothetical protein